MRCRCPRALGLGAALAGALALAAAPAGADVSGPDDSLASAYGPFVASSPLSGAFTPSDDVDYLRFQVTSAGQSLHFAVANTTATCNSTTQMPCPVWGTLLDASGQQLGGEGSTAGTGEVDQGDSDAIDWTFPAPGTYYLAMDSAGDSPTYSVRYDVVPAGTSSGSGSAPSIGASTSGPPVPLADVLPRVVVSSPQRGPVVRVRVSVARHLRWLAAGLVTGSGPPTAANIAAQTVHTQLSPGHLVLALRLSASARRTLAARHRLKLRMLLAAATDSGSTVALARSVVVLR